MNEPEVRRINRSNGEEELVPVSSAVEKLIPYYNLSKEQISEALLSQVPMTTAGYVYATTNLPAHHYKMAADISDIGSGYQPAVKTHPHDCHCSICWWNNRGAFSSAGGRGTR